MHVNVIRWVKTKVSQFHSTQLTLGWVIILKNNRSNLAEQHPSTFNCCQQHSRPYKTFPCGLFDRLLSYTLHLYFFSCLESIVCSGIKYLGWNISSDVFFFKDIEEVQKIGIYLIHLIKSKMLSFKTYSPLWQFWCLTELPEFRCLYSISINKQK